MRSPTLFLRLSLASLVLSGCSHSGEEAPRVREVDAARLPSLNDPSRTADPSVEAAGPQGWKRLERKDDQYLIGWYGGGNSNVLPRLFLRRGDWTGKAPDTTPGNVLDLAAEFDRSLQARQQPPLEWPQAMLLGGQPWVRYVDEARLGNARAEKQILHRVVKGKLFTVELQVYPGKILESRDQAYAVAAALNFDAAAAPSAEIPSEEAETEPATDATQDSPSA
jgi:hypothetical protein